MAIIDRLKKRIETDIDDSELQLLIDEANQEVIRRFGPHANPATPITVALEGIGNKLILDRPIDVSQTIAITEYITEWGWGFTPYTLLAADYYIWPSGYVIERLTTGSQPSSHWPERVEITYTPVNDGDQREEVIIKLVILSIQYDALSVRTVGDVSANSVDYTTERENILSSLRGKRLKFA